jgi:hypothetical protein
VRKWLVDMCAADFKPKAMISLLGSGRFNCSLNATSASNAMLWSKNPVLNDENNAAMKFGPSSWREDIGKETSQ